MERLIAGITLAIALVVMASVFSPHRTLAEDHSETDNVQHETALPTEDPHSDFQALGTLEHRRFTVHVYSHNQEPRYTVCDNEDGTELGVLMTADEVAEWFPELPIPEIDFTSRVHIMLYPGEQMDLR